MPEVALIYGEPFAVYADHLNTPRRLTDAQGRPRWQWAFSGFGEQAAQSIPRANLPTIPYSLRYPGQVDDGNGLFYNFNRFYDPLAGRYTSADPIGLDGGWNRFGYVGGDAISFTDPSGLQRAAIRRSYGSGNSRQRRFDRRHAPLAPARSAVSDAWFDAAGYFDDEGVFICLRWRCNNDRFDPSCQSPSFDNMTSPRQSSEFLPAATDPMNPPAGCTCDTPAWRAKGTPGLWETQDWIDLGFEVRKRYFLAK